MRRHDLAKSIFLEALDTPEADRTAFVESECRGQPALLEDVRALLANHAETLAGFPVLEVVETPPDRVGPYRILGELGRGGMGVVHLALGDDGREVALKRLRPGAVSPALLARLRREANVLARLDHPGIARLVDTGVESGESGPRPWLAMERVEGVNLAEWARTHTEPAERLDVLARIADAVAHAHAHDVVHRDLKPENVMVRPDGRPVVLDFGVARLTESDVRATTIMTSAGLIVGTVRYMSPEQAEARPEGIGPPSDVYALGVLGYELMAGRMPYVVPQHSVHRALLAVMTAPPDSIPELPRPLRPRLERLFRAALAKQPERRLPSAAAFAEDVRRIARGRAPLARPRREDTAAGPAVWRLLAALGSAALLVGWGLSAWRTPPTPADWAGGLLRPAATFGRACDALDSAAVRLHVTTRTLEREREALAWTGRAQALARTIGWRPYGARLGRLVRFRQGEAEYLIAERTTDAPRFEKAATLWYESREPRIPAERGPLPVMRSLSASQLTAPPDPSPWLSASMALSDAARLVRPQPLLARAIQYAEGAERQLDQQAATAAGRAQVDPATLAAERAAVSGRLGVAHTWHGYHARDAAEMADGLERVRRVLALPDARIDPASYASALHDLGAGEARWAALTRRREAVDSALVHLGRAWEVRRDLEGYTSAWLSRLELAQAHRLAARLEPGPGIAVRHLSEAERLLSVSPADLAALGPADAALYALALAGTRIDFAILARDTAGFGALEAGLVRLQARPEVARNGVLSAEAIAQRARLSALRWARAHDAHDQLQTRQAMSLLKLALGEGASDRWFERVGVAVTAITRGTERFDLDYPLPEPY